MLNALAMTAVIATAPTSAELTVYNGGFALVKENRSFELKSGRQQVAVGDVAQLIEPTSVAIRSTSAPGSFTVLEQNYRYDLISVQAILHKAVGKTIWFNRTLPNGTKERLEGTLMSAPTAIVGSTDGGSSMTYNGMVVKLTDGRILLNPSGEVEVAEIPEGLISTPTLVWDLESKSAGVNNVEMSYITQGMSWKADYVLSMDQAGKIGDLKGWVTMNNSCGAAFKDAKLKLLAGDVQRVQEQTKMMRGRPGTAAAMADGAGFAEETFADYHLYTLGRPATILNNEIKQLSLLEAVNIPITKKLIIDPMLQYRGMMPNEGEYGVGDLKPQVRIEFTNDEKSKLGMPLPEGNFKVFQRDSSGSVQLLGEDHITHTPKNERLSLVVGYAFDIRATRKRTAFEWIKRGNSNVGAIETYSIEVRNRKNSAESVHLLERHWGQWKITKSSHKFVNQDAELAVCVLDLKAEETQTVTFTVETRW